MNSENKYIITIKEIKSAILNSRYRVAKLANKELLLLYYKIGAKISKRITKEKWGAKVIQNLSKDLQRELPGLRGFSYGNLKKMRQFYETWNSFGISPTPLSQLERLTDKISPTLLSQFKKSFFNIGFSLHIEILSKTETYEERIFYIIKAAQEVWSIRTLRYFLNSKLFEHQASLPNNFEKTLPKNYQKKALNSFKDQYLLDFLRIADEDEDDEKVLENEIVLNIKKFIMSIGNDFAFLGNQYRIAVDGQEYFIDLLFYNRTLQALVAFELKTGKFKPEYAGKMNFYLSVLDEYIKKPYENPSIGIILCKEKNNKIVEFAFRNLNTPMGVATYRITPELPKEYKNILPDAETLKKLIK